MGPVPSSIMAAIALSAAAGKNPWIPFAILFLLAAPAGVPSWVMDPNLHAAVHGLGPAGLLYGLGGVFLVLSILDSVADKIPLVERWLVPVSTTWRPFAGAAVATVIAVGTAQGAAQATEAAHTVAAAAATLPPFIAADFGAVALGMSTFVLTIVGGTVFGALATVGKTGTRLLLSLVPLPGLRLAHSFLDDFFALAVAFVGLGHGTNIVFVAAAGLYLLVGLVTGPLLSRLAFIHLRIGIGLVRKGWRKLRKAPPAPPEPPPAWLAKALTAEGIDPASVTTLPVYAYRAPVIGRCRAGLLVIANGSVWFAARAMFRPRILRVSHDELARIGLAQTTTSRMITLVDRLDSGALRETVLYLFPAVEDDVLPLLDRGSQGAGLARVRIDSASAREALAGFAHRGESVRFLPAEEAGSLRMQALTTIVTAVAIGLLTGGVFIPIGAGYMFSPFKRRFLFGLAMSVYLSLCVVGTGGLGWPAALVYATLINAITLRDLARNALKARIDGFVDKRAFLPPVSDRVWVPERGLRAETDRWHEGDSVPVTDGTWRKIAALLAEPAPEPAFASVPGPEAA